MRRGYVRLWRCSEDSAVWQDDRLWRLWCHLLIHARYDDGWVSIDGLAKPISVLRGQLMVGRMAIHKSLYPKKRKYTPSPSTVWRRLQTLRDMGNITLEMNSRFTMVTICNYDTYNSVQLQNEQVIEQPVNSRRTAGEQPTDTKKKEKKVKKVEEGKKEASCTEPGKPASEQEVVLTYPTVGIGAKTWDLTKTKLEEYAETFPDLDVLAECRKALQWIRDNPTKRKSAAGMPKYLGNWLNRQQNSGRGTASTSDTPPKRNLHFPAENNR